ncbi:MAG: hypothetical protein HY820_23890 [Acidobacteria bacterium]|nr:hypothetical protein [Acidobacteriota bacterium]
MTQTATPTLSQIEVLLAQNGYDVSEAANGVLQVRDLDTGVSFQAALEGNVLYMTLKLTDLKSSSITADMLRKMLDGTNGITTSSFKLYQDSGKSAITLNNFCTLQNMGPEDADDILSLAGYLMADLMEARELLGPAMDAEARG